MTAKASLKALLEGVKNRDTASNGSRSKDEKIAERATAIRQLFDSLTAWLAPSVEGGVATIERDAYVHFDDVLGDLKEESLKLVVGTSTVFFAPRVGRIAGALARVDMSQGARTVPLVYLAERGWHILIRGAVTTTDALTEESFVAVLEEILG